MAYGPRLDAPGVLHHVMARGIERRDLFRDDGDRQQFLLRLETALRRTGTSVYAWALIPKHVQLLQNRSKSLLVEEEPYLLEQVAEAAPWRSRPRNPSAFVRALAQRTAVRFGLSAAALLGQRWRYTAARAVVCYVAVHHARLTLRAVASGLGVSAPTVLRGARTGASVLAEHGIDASDLLP